MTYLVITQDPVTGQKGAFETEWFNPENNWNPESMIAVIQPRRGLISFDGETWEDIEEDCL